MNEQKLQELVHGRYTLEELRKEVNTIAEEPMIVEHSTDEYLEDEDYKLDIGGVDSGYGTIWYLLTRDNKMYITEIVYENEE